VTTYDLESLNTSSALFGVQRIFNAPLVYAGSHSEVPLGAEAEGLRIHRVQRGIPLLSPAAFAEAVNTSELTGRGGAHIPATWKLTAAMEAGPGGTVVVNGAEGELGSAKDAALLQLRPHLVLDGAIAVAEAIGAAEIVLWVHESSTATRSRLVDAVRERRGEIPVPVRLLLAPEGYVGGEASAVISAVRGGPALPRHSRDRARPWGEGPAVLVHNAETHARLGLIALGHDPTATSLVTVAESSAPLHFTRRTVMEVTREQTFREVVAAAGAMPPTAVLLGGMGGIWASWRDAADLPIDADVLRARGLTLGAGIVHLLPAGRDGLVEAAAIADRLAAESARQCGPCVFGLPALAEAVSAIAQGGAHARERSRVSGPRGRDIASLTDLIAGRGACRHPDGATRMVLSAMEVFGQDVHGQEVLGR